MSYQNEFSEKVDNVGNLKISEDVVAAITRIATKEVEGVAELAVAPSNIKGFFKSKPIKSAVSVDLNDGVAVIDVYLKIKYGAKVQSVASEIQKKIKDSVQNMTSIAVSKVNIHVSGIVIDEKNKK
ncbi:MAG: Asp23/Gls24 family envelope stress response protein [Ruminococcaceae bacterium]|nr:Asp23/Gls24 family envelope stress response protein [Oscillospiraceae bacterium]